MSFATIKVDPERMKEQYATIIRNADGSALNDTEWEALYYDSASSDLKVDLQHALGIAESDTSSLDTLATNHELFLQKSLEYKVLTLWFSSNRDINDSQREKLFIDNEGYYNINRAKFETLNVSVPVYKQGYTRIV